MQHERKSLQKRQGATRCKQQRQLSEQKDKTRRAKATCGHGAEKEREKRREKHAATMKGANKNALHRHCSCLYTGKEEEPTKR